MRGKESGKEKEGEGKEREGEREEEWMREMEGGRKGGREF